MNSRKRAIGRDIVELFGYSADDCSDIALSTKRDRICAILQAPCTKTNHDQTVIYGTCSVTSGSRSSLSHDDVIICPKRLYANSYEVIKKAAMLVWPNASSVIVGGNLQSLKERASKEKSPVVAFGQGSGKEVAFSAGGELSIDWVLQRYNMQNGKLEADSFICLEVQSIDITGNYRNAWEAYMQLGNNNSSSHIPNSEHGLNWANVHKRLIPQLIRKGNVASSAPRCKGVFFILPDIVYKKFEAVIGEVKQETTFGRNNLTVITYALDEEGAPGMIRPLKHIRTVHHSLKEIAEAFVAKKDPSIGIKLDQTVGGLLGK